MVHGKTVEEATRQLALAYANYLRPNPNPLAGTSPAMIEKVVSRLGPAIPLGRSGAVRV